MPDPREVVSKATEEIRNTTIELYREWQGADAEVARLRDELDGVRARARAYIESMHEGSAEAEIIGDVLWDNRTLIRGYKARAGERLPDHVWSTEYDSVTHRAVGGCWVPIPAVAAAVSFRRDPAPRWEIRLDTDEVREWFEDAASAWRRWDSDFYDRHEHMLYDPDGKLLAHGTLDSRLMREGRSRFTSEVKPERHITDGRDRKGIEWTKCGLIANDPEDPNSPECVVCRSLDG